MRVVIDTNVFISSFLGKGGNPRKVIDFWKEGTITMCLSKGIIDEYIEVLYRLGISKKEIDEILKLFTRSHNSIFTANTKNINFEIKDADDKMFFECAVTLNAEYIISGDKVVLAVENYAGIKVVNPKQFVELMQS